MISNVLERQVKSYEQTSGVFNFIQRNYVFIANSAFVAIRFKLY